MYEINETTEFIEEKSGSETHKFYLFNHYERLALISELKERKRSALLRNLGDAGAEVDLKMGELEQFESWWSEKWNAEYLAFVNGPESDVYVPEKALRLDDPKEAKRIVSALRLTPQQMLSFKAALLGLSLVAKSDEKPEEPAGPNPQIPPTYSTTK